jgi:hypothetical protein
VPIRRGEDWGGVGPLAPDGVVVADDAAARAVVEAARRAGGPLPELGLLGGDLCRTLGGRGDEARLRSASATRLEVDVGAALVDGRLHWFVAHLVARRSWWRGRVVALMNAEHLGAWDVAPRAHPGDGRLELLDADLGWRDRWGARSRLPSGAHVPHPGITERRVAAWQDDLAPPLDVWLDGERIGRASTLSVRVEPAALTVVV